MAINKHINLRKMKNTLSEVNVILKTYINNFVSMATITIVNDKA